MIYRKRKTYYDKFPTTKNIPKKGDIWLVKFPYETKGNIEKVRPVLVSDVKEESYLCRKITSNSSKGKRIQGFLEKYFNRPSYITKTYKVITIDKFYRRIYASKENK